jgi:hypothetical protein
MEDAMAWLARTQRFWTESLDRLAAAVEGARTRHEQRRDEPDAGPPHEASPA